MTRWPIDLARARQPGPAVPPPARVAAVPRIDPARFPADQVLLRRFGPEACLARRVLPWRAAGGAVIVAAEDRASFAAAAPDLRRAFGRIARARIAPGSLDPAVVAAAGPALARRAEARPPAALSCRGWRIGRARAAAAALTLGLAAGGILAPAVLLTALALWTLLTLALLTGLKAAALLLYLRRPPARRDPVPAALPTISLLVPLFREGEIASRLLARLAVLRYPAEKLDICLVLEAGDRTTRAALSRADLPAHMRVIEVPLGPLTTKPRAMNYALPFARGEVVGIYDAEDAPGADHLLRVAARFAAAPDRVACLQGALDFYNARRTWLTRCFTLEYGMWFRVLLPGLVRMGLPIPLGGTTLFLRRPVLEAVGGWDAHNVTEDADLGLRLARAGYRCELIDITTGEEATARAGPWIRQRSRWLKGYAITWAVHMRAPLRLWRELGPAGFLSVQALFLGTLTQFALAPLLWGFWGAVALSGAVLPGPAVIAATGILLGAQALTLLAAAVAARATGRPGLAPWALTLPAYFALATLACWKGLAELLSRPFYWDKTAHGMFHDGGEGAAISPGRGRDA